MRDPGSRSPTSQRPKLLTRSFLPSEESGKAMSGTPRDSFSLLKPADKDGKDSSHSPDSPEYKKDDSPRSAYHYLYSEVYVLLH